MRHIMTHTPADAIAIAALLTFALVFSVLLATHLL